MLLLGVWKWQRHLTRLNPKIQSRQGSESSFGQRGDNPFLLLSTPFTLLTPTMSCFASLRMNPQHHGLQKCNPQSGAVVGGCYQAPWVTKCNPRSESLSPSYSIYSIYSFYFIYSLYPLKNICRVGCRSADTRCLGYLLSTSSIDKQQILGKSVSFAVPENATCRYNGRKFVTMFIVQFSRVYRKTYRIVVESLSQSLSQCHTTHLHNLSCSLTRFNII